MTLAADIRIIRALVYEASPECRARRCLAESWDDPQDSAAVFFRHGPNPEAVCRLDRSLNICRQFREFAERCHRYDDGEQV